MAFAGLRGTGSFGTDERPKNFREMILWANPNGAAPIFALMARAKKESVNDPEFSWWEESLRPTRVLVNYTTGFSTTDNTITIASGGLDLVPGSLLMVEKTETTAFNNEVVMVSSVTSDTVIVIRRGAANTTAAPIADTVAMTKVGSAFEEGSNGPEISQRNPTKYSNYCQIFKTGMGQTASTPKMKVRTGDAWNNDKKRKSFDHSKDLEMAILFGRKYEETGPGGFPRRYMGGIRSFLSTNVTIFATTPTEDTFLNAIYPVFNYNKGGAGDERIIFAGNGFLNSMNKLARNSSSTRINFSEQLMNVYGMKLQRWTTPQGTFGVKSHPLLNLHPRFTYSAFIIDPTGLIYRPYRDTFFKDNTQANDADARKAHWLTEAGLEVQHEETMGYLGNFVV